MRISGDHAIDAFANGRRLPDPEKAAQEFEAFLVSAIWKQGQQGPRWSKLLGDGSAEAMTRSMWIDEVVTRAVSQRGLGLAERLERRDPGASGPEGAK